MSDWRHRAACQVEDPELFFPIGTARPALLQIAEAKTVSRRCPVITDCLTWALQSGQDAGVWGGMSEDERRTLKRRNRRARTRLGDDQSDPAADPASTSTAAHVTAGPAIDTPAADHSHL